MQPRSAAQGLRVLSAAGGGRPVIADTPSCTARAYDGVTVSAGRWQLVAEALLKSRRRQHDNVPALQCILNNLLLITTVLFHLKRATQRGQSAHMGHDASPVEALVGSSSFIRARQACTKLVCVAQRACFGGAAHSVWDRPRMCALQALLPHPTWPVRARRDSSNALPLTQGTLRSRLRAAWPCMRCARLARPCRHFSS